MRAPALAAALVTLAEREGLTLLDERAGAVRLGHPHPGPWGWYTTDSVVEAARVSEASDEDPADRHSAVADALARPRLRAPVLRGVRAELYEPHVAYRNATETSQREIRVRVLAALRNSGVDEDAIREATERMRGWVPLADPGALTAPAGSLDLGCALEALGHDCDALVVGELSLAGQLRPVRGVLAALLAARDAGVRSAIVPAGCALVADRIRGIEVRVAETLADVLAGRLAPVVVHRSAAPQRDALSPDDLPAHLRAVFDEALEEVRSGRSILLRGMPGVGKTMVARRLTSALPALSAEEEQEVARIADAAGILRHDQRGPLRRPFRAPHHTASVGALVGAGDPVRPGELTIAHHGILFLDELPEFSMSAIGALSTGVREGAVSVYRRGLRVRMPARPIVVAAANPCACAHAMGCRCERRARERYEDRIGEMTRALGIERTIDLPARHFDGRPL